MPSSKPITQIAVLHLKEGVNLANVTSSDPNPAVQAFLESANSLKAQQGFIHIRGHEVEHPNLFVWSIDWESFELYTAFAKSEDHTSIVAGILQVFDFEVAAPVTLYIHVVNNEAALKALRSPVTEVSFFIMPTRPDEETKTAIEEASVASLREVETIGKASGATIGWVFDAVPPSIISGPDAVSLYGVFGYASIDVHMKWRETPEGIKAGQAAAESMRPATVVPGIDPSTGYFHVKFREGV